MFCSVGVNFQVCVDIRVGQTGFVFDEPQHHSNSHESKRQGTLQNQAVGRFTRTLAADRRRLTGSPTEVALLRLAMLAAMNLDESYRRYPLRKVQHRGDARRYMVTVHAVPGGRSFAFVKGDPADVLDICSGQLRGGRRVELSEAEQNAIEIQNQHMAGEGLRVLGFACGSIEEPSAERLPIGELTWIGLVGMAEPIRDRHEPLFPNRDMRALFSESAVLPGGSLAAFG